MRRSPNCTTSHEITPNLISHPDPPTTHANKRVWHFEFVKWDQTYGVKNVTMALLITWAFRISRLLQCVYRSKSLVTNNKICHWVTWFEVLNPRLTTPNVTRKATQNNRPSFSHGYTKRIGNDTSIAVYAEVCIQFTEYKVQIVSKPVHQLDNCITWTIATRFQLVTCNI